MTDELMRALGRRQRTDPNDVPEELARPFDPRERDAVLDAVFETLEDQAPQGEPPKDRPLPADVTRLDPRRRRAMAVGLVALATAAAALVALWLRATPRNAAPAALPSYNLTRFSGGVAAMRSQPATMPSTVTLTSESSIDWIFTPEQPVEVPVGLALVVEPTHADGSSDTTVVHPRSTHTSPEGVVRLRGRLDEFVPLAPGAWTINALFGTPDRLPRTAPQARLEGGWPRVTIQVNIVPPK